MTEEQKRELFAQIDESQYAEIQRYILRLVRQSALAEDFTQETFIRAARYLGGPSGQTAFRALLYRIAANLCVDALRSVQAEPLSEHMASADDGFAAAEAQDGFLRMLDVLPAEQRELIRLRYGQDLKLREVAAIMGLPLRTVQSRLRAALKLLKTELEKKGERP